MSVPAPPSNLGGVVGATQTSGGGRVSIPARRLRLNRASVATIAIGLTIGLSPTAMAATTGKLAPVPLCVGATKQQAVKAIKRSWNTFFDGSSAVTPDQRFAVVDGGADPAFRATLDDLTTANAAVLKATRARVRGVACAGTRGASVRYVLVINGTPAPGLVPTGSAVLVGRRWKVTASTVCDLFAPSNPDLLQLGPCAR